MQDPVSSTMGPCPWEIVRDRDCDRDRESRQFSFSLQSIILSVKFVTV